MTLSEKRLSDSEKSFTSESGVNTPIDRFRSALAGLVETNRASAAAQLVLNAHDRQLAPSGESLRPWIIALAGDDAWGVVTRGFARLHSGCCENGFEPCEACEGTGFFNDTCVACVGLGQVRCGFCGGTSLVPYEGLPGAVVAEVASIRLKLVQAGLDAITKAANDELHGFASVEQSVRNLKNAEKLQAVVENALIPARRAPRDGRLSELVPSLEEIARKIRVLEFKGILKSLQQAWRVRAVEATDATRAEADARAKFYERLRRSGAFLGTGLARPFLFAADKQGLRPPSEPGPRADNRPPAG